MSQHDYFLENQSGQNFRADLNNALSAIATNNSGATEPSTTFAYELWVDTANSVLKIRNSANDAWITTGISITADNTFTGNITGNASTATALETARTINGTSFDGTANISFDTDSVNEGSTNLYFTSARFDSSFSTKSTSDLTEGTNLYYTDTRFDTRLATKDTDDLTEGTNLYFTNARVESYLDAGTSTPTFASAVINSSITGSAVLDDDTFATASATTIATSESIKAYVDSQVGTVDTLAEILSNGNTTGGTDIAFGDNDKAIFGASADLQIYHDGTNSYINDTGTGNLIVKAGDDLRLQSGTGENYLVATTDSGVQIYHDNVKKVETTTSGINVVGDINLNDGYKAVFGNSSDLEIYHDGSNSYITDVGTGNLLITGNLTGDVTGTVSSLANHDTADLAEGTNLYYTDARSRAAISASGDISYNSTTGVISFTETVAPVTSVFGRTGVVVATSGDYTTAQVTESGNLYYTDARVQAVSINNLVEDTTPQLGGDLDLNSNDITGTGNINITGTIQSSGNITGTLATATQPNITSVGTLTGFTSTGIDDNATATALTITSSENVGIKNTSPSALLHIGDSSNSLGTTAGDELSVLTLQSDTSNGDYLLFTTERLSDGSTWATAAHKIQRKVDTTEMGYMQFGSGGSDLVTFGEGSTEYVRIDGAGQLGVGTDTPLAKFHTKKDGTGQIIALFSSDLGTNDRNMGILSPASDSTTAPFEFSTANSFQFTIDGGAALNIASDKSVGIGTASPARELELSAANPRFRITDTDGGYAEISGNTGHLALQADVGNTQAGSRIDFEIDGSSKARLTDAGKFGVGTTSITGFLHSSTGSSGATPTSDANELVLEASTNVGMSLLCGNTGIARIRFGDSDSNARGNVMYNHNSDSLIFQTAGSNAMTIDSSGNVSITGSISKGSGSFKIDHPLESKKDTHHLVHSFVEAPQADNIYRGKSELVNGTVSINIDEYVGMTEGTFVALNREIQVFTSNETDWDAVKGNVTGNTLTITSQNTESNAEVSWLVIGERQDANIYESDLTDNNGKIIIEPKKI